MTRHSKVKLAWYFGYVVMFSFYITKFILWFTVGSIFGELTNCVTDIASDDLDMSIRCISTQCYIKTDSTNDLRKTVIFEHGWWNVAHHNMSSNNSNKEI